VRVNLEVNLNGDETVQKLVTRNSQFLISNF